MNPQQIRLGLVLQEAGVTVKTTQFAQRLILQKSGYLLQEFGIHLGYRFSWYVRGPYSPDYTDDVFTLAQAPPEEIAAMKSWKLTAPSRKKIGELKGLFSAAWKKSDPARWLELLASALFLIRTKQAAADNAAEVSRILKANGKQFSPHEVAEGVAELRHHGYSF